MANDSGAFSVRPEVAALPPAFADGEPAEVVVEAGPNLIGVVKGFHV